MKNKEKEIVKEIIRKALEEDIGDGDITSFFCVSPERKTKGIIIAKEDCLLCGIDITKEVFKTVNYSLKFKKLKKDGELVNKNEVIAEIKGEAISILKAERVALNFLSMLSGIATHTREFVEKVKNTPVKIMDTRKTTPALRILEKYAVRVGGGVNHRKGLWDGILIKDNHLRVSGIISGGKFNENNLKKIIEIIRTNTKYEIEIEVENFQELKRIIKYNPDIILLDNFSLKQIMKAVKFRNHYFPRVKLEASGGINLYNVERIAKTGVDFISVGSITHSPQSIDFSLEIDE